MKIHKLHFSQVGKNILKCSKFGNYSIISKPGNVSLPLKVPDFISKPYYFNTGLPPKIQNDLEIKAEWQISSMRKACQIARIALNELSDNLKVGFTTAFIDSIVHHTTLNHSAYPSPLNYHGFPKSCCTSVNNVACHGIPDDRPLEDGDIISVDVTVFYDGYHGDCCETFLIGNVDKSGQKLVEIARKCRDAAISICGPNVPFSAIGNTIERIAAEENLQVVPAFIGHGIGQYFHGPPEIYHCHNNYPGVMKPGMTFTIEPVIAQGEKDVIILEDGWTAVMMDNGRAAQFEHTILITEDGHDILTKY